MITVNTLLKGFTTLGLCFILMAIDFGCRKGENDPWISLRSRKSRLTGEWKLVSSEGYGTGGVLAHSFDGQTYIDYSDEPEYPDTAIYKETLVIKKDNTFTWNWSGVHSGPWRTTNFTNLEGNWYFLDKSKNQDYKNKERIAFQKMKNETGYSDAYSGTTSWIYWYKGDRDDYLLTFAINGLSNKKLILTFEYLVESNENPDKSYTETKVFEKQ